MRNDLHQEKLREMRRKIVIRFAGCVDQKRCLQIRQLERTRWLHCTSRSTVDIGCAEPAWNCMNASILKAS